MLLSAFLSKRFRAYSGHKDEKNGFVSFIAKASTIGILLGVAVLIVALSVINGFEQQYKQWYEPFVYLDISYLVF